MLLSEAVRSEAQRSATLRNQAEKQFARALDLDAGLLEADAMLGVTEILRGDCSGGSARIDRALANPMGLRRKYPFETGTGATLDASIGRHVLIRDLSDDLDPRERAAACRDA